MEKIYGFVRMDIHPGKTEAFIEGAAECHRAASPDLRGTQLYEWFLSEDGREAWVIEVYDDPAAVAHHSKMLDGRATVLREFADIEIVFAGLVPDTIRESIRQRLGAVEYFGGLSQGLLNEPVDHRNPGDTSGRISALAWFTPHEGKAERLRELSERSFAKAKSDDPGTMAYEWFFDAQGRALALDVYRDAEAMVGHMKNCGPIMAEILKIADSRTQVYGELPDELAARMRPELGITRFPRRLHGIF
jgi:quinol monooxygenase YgiN